MLLLMDSDRTRMVYSTCESCEQHRLLRPHQLDDETFYVCEDCTPTKERKQLWD